MQVTFNAVNFIAFTAVISGCESDFYLVIYVCLFLRVVMLKFRK